MEDGIVILYPDIIVLSDIIASISILIRAKSELNTVHINIDTLIKYQKEYTGFGISGMCWISNTPDGEWTKEDYRNYFNKFHKYFKRIDEDIFEIDISNFHDIEEMTDKLLDHGYSINIAKTIGISA